MKTIWFEFSVEPLLTFIFYFNGELTHFSMNYNLLNKFVKHFYNFVNSSSSCQHPAKQVFYAQFCLDVNQVYMIKWIVLIQDYLLESQMEFKYKQKKSFSNAC